jgi:hypothetical protein
MLPQWFGHALKYLGDLVVLAAVLVAVLGETRFQNEQGLRSITKSGWAAMALVVAGLLMSSRGTGLTVRRQTFVAKTPEAAGGGGTSGYFVMSKDTWNGDLYSAAGAGGVSPLGAADKLCLRELTTLTSWQGYLTAKSNGKLVASKVHAFLCNGDNGCNNLQPETTYYFANAGDTRAGGASFTTGSNGNGPQDDATWSGGNYFGGDFSYWTDRDWLWSGSSYNNGAKSSTSWGTDSWAAKNGDSQTCNPGWSYGRACGNGAIYGSTNSGNDWKRWWTNGACCNTQLHLICFVNP